MIPDTLWTIAGRNKLRWDGELADELEQHLITALSPEDSNWFLERAGISDENLRGELVRLTEGYPIFLDLCVDVYIEYKRQHNNEPTIAEFGQKRQDVVARIFRYFNEAGDDAAKDMLEFFCVLGVWTDEIAVDIGGQALHNFSRNTYKRVKIFSFIESCRVEDDDINFTAYNFNRTIQSILFDDCDEKLIVDVKAAVNEYFKKFFAGKRTFDPKEIFYLKLWANFIVRFNDDAETLREQYNDKLKNYVDALIEYANFNAAAEILNLFMIKLENLGKTDTISYAHFELNLSRCRRAQGKYNETCKAAKSAYEKFSRLSGDEHPDTLNAMNIWAISLSGLSRYDEALTLQEKILTLRKKILGENHPDTLGAMNNLAITLKFSGRYEKALTLQEQVLSLRKEIFGDEHPETLMAMNNFALTLNKLGRYEEALKLQEKILPLRKKILGDNHPDTLGAMNNLAVTLCALGHYDEALTLMKQVLPLRKEILGENHPDTLRSMQALANLLSRLDRYEEAVNLQSDALDLFTKTVKADHPLTIDVMKDLAKILFDGGKREEALRLIERATNLAQKVFGDKHPETKEILELHEKILHG